MQRLTGHSLRGPEASPIPLLLPSTPSCAGQPLPRAWVPGCPPQREGNCQGSLGFAAGCCLGANPACAIGGSVPGQVIAPSGLDFVMQKLEMVHLCHPPRAVVRMTAVMHSAQQASDSSWSPLTIHCERGCHVGDYRRHGSQVACDWPLLDAFADGTCLGLPQADGLALPAPLGHLSRSPFLASSGPEGRCRSSTLEVGPPSHAALSESHRKFCSGRAGQPQKSRQGL